MGIWSRIAVAAGAAGEAAIYTEHFHELSLLRKILLRMRSGRIIFRSGIERCARI
jgi:hypothetical protein